MNLRGFLLSAAGLAAGLAAGPVQAADYVAAEPIDFLKVCDAYGTGYWYIPGTDVCLRIGGYVRADFMWDDGLSDSHYDFKTRARLNIWAKSETDLGTLTGFIRGQGDSNAQNFDTDRAWITLGGFFAGLDRSFFDYDGGNGGYTLEKTGFTSARTVDHIGYSYAPKSGLGYFISLEENWKVTGYDYPDLIGGLSFVSGPFDARLSAAIINEASGWAIQAAGSLKLDQIAKGDAIRFIFAYGENAGYFTAVDQGIGTGAFLMGPSWSVVASGRHYFKPELVGAVTGSYVTAGGQYGWQAVASLNYSPAKNMWIGPEFAHIYNSSKADPTRNILMLRFLREF